MEIMDNDSKSCILKELAAKLNQVSIVYSVPVDELLELVFNTLDEWRKQCQKL